MTQQHTFTVGKYLAMRLEQMGLKHYFVVPGDYNLTLLDQLLTNHTSARTFLKETKAGGFWRE